MRLLLDQGLPRAAVDLLAAKGHDCVHVATELVHDADDGDIIELARAQDRSIISLDADFHTQLALASAVKPTTVRLRVEGLKADELATLIDRVCILCADEMTAGAMISVDAVRVRVRRLPL